MDHVCQGRRNWGTRVQHSSHGAGRAWSDNVYDRLGGGHWGGDCVEATVYQVMRSLCSTLEQAMSMNGNEPGCRQEVCVMRMADAVAW
eukprot:1151382-Amphidinium_carterae.1